MITTKDQNELFELISQYLERDIDCIAIGGTAMMYYNYKDSTKDIDLVFKNVSDRDVFIKAISELGYSKKSLQGVYDEKRINDSNKPLMYSRGDERFDLFVCGVFGLKLDVSDFDKRVDFVNKSDLRLFILSEEYLVLLKSITNREKDFEDIENIVRVKKNLDWNLIIDQAILRKGKNAWILIDLEAVMQNLKRITFIPSKYFQKIYDVCEEK